MLERDKHIRLGLVLLTISLVGLALYLPRSDREHFLDRYFVTGTYRSGLLDKEVSPEALQAAARSESSRSVVGGNVEVEARDDSPYLVQVTTSTRDKAQLESAHERAIRVLSTSLRETALIEINEALRHIAEFKKETAKVRESRPESSGSFVGPSEARLSEAETGRIHLAQQEMQQLESFFEGAELPKALRVRLDRKSLSAAEERVRSAERELSRLATLFHPTKDVVRAQHDYVQKKRDELRSLEEHLAKAYFKTLKLELKILEDKALSLVEENAARDEASILESATAEPTAENDEWIRERERVLESRAEKVRSEASLKLESELEYGENGGRASHLSSICWLAALGSFLALLFLPNSTGERGRETPFSRPVPSPEKPLAYPSKSLRKIDLSSFLSESQAGVPVDHFEVFFSSIFEEVSRALGRHPRRILVLGDQSVEARLAFSIRLANNLGRELGSVRLIDFDLQAKSLSERLGRQSLPGVGDLLMGGGPVEEFFSSIAGTKIQFAPAGSIDTIEQEVDPRSVSKILGETDQVTIIDASSASPLHLIVHQVDAVLYATQDVALTEKSARERQVLIAFRDAGLPIWGVSVRQSQFFPLL